MIEICTKFKTLHQRQGFFLKVMKNYWYFCFVLFIISYLDILTIDRRKCFNNVSAPETESVKLLLLCVRLIRFVLAKISQRRKCLSNSSVPELQFVILLWINGFTFLLWILAKISKRREGLSDCSVAKFKLVKLLFLVLAKFIQRRQCFSHISVP